MPLSVLVPVIAARQTQTFCHFAMPGNASADVCTEKGTELELFYKKNRLKTDHNACALRNQMGNL